MRIVKYLWAAALSMGVVLIFCSLSSFVGVYLGGRERTLTLNLLWGADYACVTAAMTRLAVKGRWRTYFACIALLILYIFRRAATAAGADIAPAIMVVISVYSAFICFFASKEGLGGILFFPVVLWHIYLSGQMLGLF